MKTFEYNVDLTNKTVLKTDEEQFDKLFYSGHPAFLIPDFQPYNEDIWLSFMDYLEREKDVAIYDQDGGEISGQKVIDTITGLTKCNYEAYDIVMDVKTFPNEPISYVLDIEGYVILENQYDAYFLTTKVTINENI